jgi:hypothetical protein
MGSSGKTETGGIVRNARAWFKPALGLTDLHFPGERREPRMRI